MGIRWADNETQKENHKYDLILLITYRVGHKGQVVKVIWVSEEGWDKIYYL